MNVMDNDEASSLMNDELHELCHYELHSCKLMQSHMQNDLTMLAWYDEIVNSTDAKPYVQRASWAHEQRSTMTQTHGQ
jgi:hypothetical protein